MHRIEKDSAIPYYYQLADILREEITSDRHSQGDVLPSERILCEIYMVSRATVRQAIQILKDEGLVEKVRGIGTKIAPKPLKKVESNLLGYHDFDIQMLEKGLQGTVRIVRFGKADASNDVCHLLELEEEAPVVEVVRLRLIANEPIFIEKIYLSQRKFPEISKDAFSETNLFQQVIQKDYGIKLGEDIIYLEPIILSKKERDLLKVAEQTAPGLLTERISLTDKGVPVCVTRRIFRGDCCRHYLKVAPQ